ncbi:HdeD family acid-resistance protein [Microcella sp.]|uniref:HdeD family acid-resistance protein n=1 Tax=Microcella sp. TaxID=1913979 RepID=UPI00391C0DE1
MAATTAAPSPVVLERGFVIASAISAIALGIAALVWPGATLITVALLFGAYLVVSGIFRLVIAFTSDSLSTGVRWLVGVLGVFIIIAGIIALNNLGGTLLVMAYVIAFGWIFDGVAAIAGGVTGRTALPRWLAVLSGVVSVIGGIVLLFLPGLGIVVFLITGGWILIAVGIATLFSLPPKKGAEAAAPVETAAA